MAMKVTDLLTRLIQECRKDVARPENREISAELQGGINALVVFRSLLLAAFPDSLLLPEDMDDLDATKSG
jgi:hypothetical protein